MKIESQVLIAKDIDKAIEELKSVQTNERFVEIRSEKGFLVDEVKEVFDRASIATEETLVIIMAASSFSEVIQNRLLKLLEEPPKNKVFILIAPQKAMILDTIKSRLPLHVLQEDRENIELGIDIENLSLQSLFDFAKQHRHTKALQLRPLMDEIIRVAIKSKMFNLDYKTLEMFTVSTKSLHFGTNPNFVLSAVLLKLLANKKRKAINATLQA